LKYTFVVVVLNGCRIHAIIDTIHQVMHSAMKRRLCIFFLKKAQIIFNVNNYSLH